MTPPLTKTAQSCGCKRQESQRKPQRLSFLLTLLVAILPKCPFCAFGYSSVMVLCSGAKVHTYEANPLGYLSMVLALAVIGSLYWNFKGASTWWSIGVATLGLGLIGLAQCVTGNPLEYFVGTGLMLLAVLLNGRWYRYLKVV